MESDYTFTADSETMKAEVAFTFDATSLDGKQLVTFEELYDLSNPDEPKKVTEHKDIDNEGQTITFKEKPEVPEEPEKPKTPQTPDTPHKTDSPKTGDNTNLYGLLALLLTSGAGLAGISLIEWTEDNKIKSLKEYGCNLNNYNPYQHSDNPQFRDEKTNWF